jgi:hypothetical protein
MNDIKNYFSHTEVPEKSTDGRNIGAQTSSFLPNIALPTSHLQYMATNPKYLLLANSIV